MPDRASGLRLPGRSLLTLLPLLAGLLMLVACDPSPPRPDSGRPDSGRRFDAGDGRDAGGMDAGSPTDAGPDVDGGPIDAGPGDSGIGRDGGGPPPTTARRVIYQLVPRLFSNTNESRVVDGTLEQNGVGRFADIDETAIAELRDLGATEIWLTGVLRQATLTDYSAVDPALAADDPDIVKGRAGSFYAVRDYYDVSPDYAADPSRRMAEFEALVDRIHAAGMRVLIDLVPNHVARSYGSVIHPERDFGVGDDQGLFFGRDNSYFYLGAGNPLSLSRPAGWSPAGLVFDGAFAPEDGTPGNIARVTGNNVTSTSPSANDWYETIKLNYGLDFTTGSTSFDPAPRTWTRVDEILAYWQAKGVDGFRCDFAHFVPHPAWTYLIDRARTRDPNVFFIAEAYEDLPGLLTAGFDSVYHDAAYDTLKGIYQGARSQGDLDGLMRDLGDDAVRPRYAHYLENHDERRVASPLVPGSPDGSGFGSARAGIQLAPLLYLYSSGPILVYNGQEVGEAGAGREGFGGDDGRTSIFDYWSMPAMVGWVNGGAYDGGGLSAEQRALRDYYRDLLALVQDPSVAAPGYWGLEYFNNSGRFADCPDGFYSFARFEGGSGRLLMVVANFTPGTATTGRLRVPTELATAAGLSDGTHEIRQLLDESGAVDRVIATMDRAELIASGFEVTIPDQASGAFVIE